MVRHRRDSPWCARIGSSCKTSADCAATWAEAFEYYDFHDGGVAGSHMADEKPISEVAVSRDGKRAATAFPDGAIRFYSLPGPGKTEPMRNREFGSQLHELLIAEKFDELTSSQQALVQTKADIMDWSLAGVMSYYLETPWVDPTPDAWTAHLASVQKWLDAKPDLAPRVCHGDLA